MNNVLPGFIDSLPEKPEFRERIPMARYGTTQEIAEVIGFLASDGAAYITGQSIRVDGGITRSVSQDPSSSAVPPDRSLPEQPAAVRSFEA